MDASRLVFNSRLMIIFLFGADAFQSGQKVSEIKNKFLKSDSSSSGLSVFDFEENVDVQKILGTLETANLLAPKRLVIVKNLLAKASAENQKLFLEFLKNTQKKIIAVSYTHLTLPTNREV